MSTRDLAIAIMIALAIVVLSAMFFAWRRRLRRDAGLVAPVGVPDDAATLSRHEILYVSTTRHDQPLERLAVKPLAYRARGELVVTDQGIALHLDGEQAVFLASSTLVAIGRATVTIDRVVERDGLVRVAWLTGDDTTVDSYLRLATGDPQNLISELQRLVPAKDTGATS
ncbi:hypothetical protein [Microbacterium sp.]|uniref:PH-like domain-containing protein n=1 Tax=Microbacterium sp. TaxID=51671 RepID=UPI002616812D|nr:hypothetical protein [Microbacterium sp.]